MIEDSILIAEFANGNHKAFKEIFRKSYPRVYAFIYGFLKTRDDADEVTQMVFIKLWDKREVFREVRNFESYLFILTKHTVFNYIAARKTVPFADVENIPELFTNKTPHEELLAKDLQLLIDLTVENMPSQRKLVYRMSRVQGLSNEEIAGKLNLQKKTVENHLTLALKELRDTILLFIIFILC